MTRKQGCSWKQSIETIKFHDNGILMDTLKCNTKLFASRHQPTFYRNVLQIPFLPIVRILRIVIEFLI